MFDPTIKQLDALANMERFLGISSNRVHFQTRDDFQAYWDRLDQQCKKNRRKHQSSPNKNTSQRRQRAIDKFYRDPNTLAAYARKYYHRYPPSRQRLHRQLTQKCELPQLVEQVLNDLSSLIDDHLVAQTHLQRLRGQGKNQREIRQSLQRKEFSSKLIQQLLNDNTLTAEEELARDRRIRSLLRQGQPEQALLQRLSSTPDEREEIRQALQRIQNETQSTHTEQLLMRLRKDVEKMRRREKNDWECRALLMRKGYQREHIDQALAE